MSFEAHFEPPTSYAVAEQEEVRHLGNPGSYAAYDERPVLRTLPKLHARPVNRLVQQHATPPTAGFDSYLATLDTPAIGIQPAHAGAVRGLWRDLMERVGPDLRVPAAMPGGDLGFHLSWSYAALYVSIEVAPDGRMEWFFKDIATGEVRGSDDDEELIRPPEELIRLLVTRCLRQ
jgi:hypothetical protein